MYYSTVCILLTCTQAELAVDKNKDDDPFTRRRCKPTLVTLVRLGSHCEECTETHNHYKHTHTHTALHKHTQYIITYTNVHSIYTHFILSVDVVKWSCFFLQTKESPDTSGTVQVPRGLSQSQPDKDKKSSSSQVSHHDT